SARSWSVRSRVRSGVEEGAGVVDQHVVLGEALDQATGRLVVDDGERAQVVGADGQNPAVVVATGLLDRPRVLGHVGQLVVGLVVELLQVEDDLAGWLMATTGTLGKQLGDGYSVELGQFGQAGHGHGPVATLI